MEYRVDFNCVRELWLVGIGKNNFFNFIRASVFLIKFLNRLFYIWIFYI